MSIQKNLITLCFATVFTLGLAACGSDASLDDKKDGEGKLAGDPSVADLFATAVTSMGAAEDAGTDAADALKAATDNSTQFGTMAVGGESSVAQMNAQAVLDAKDDVDEALANAMMALQDATTAKGHADALADDDANKATLITELEEAIVEAEEQIEAIEMIRDGVALEFAVALVTGDDEDEPMSAADHGQMVAMAIDGALGPTDQMADGSGLRVVAGTNDGLALALADDDINVVMMNDHTGKTWAEIVGETSKKRLGTSDMDTEEVDAASIAGMTLTSVQGAGDIDDGMQSDATYKGIPGKAFCQGSDCKVETVAGVVGVRKFTGSWYFTPTSTTDYYLGTTTAGGTMYRQETNYAQFGHWLTVDVDTGLVVTVNPFAGGGVTGTNGGEGTNITGLAVGDDVMLGNSATYEGTAAGMSLHNDVDGDGAPVPGSLESGAFTADVTLTAKFQTIPTLGGYINGFEGDAVDPDWRVTLREGAFPLAELATGSRTTASGQDGGWTATGYGVATERPTGIFGGFNAHFTDGHAAGAYATRK